MKLVLEWSMAKRKDGWQALLQQISDKYREYGFDSRFYRSHFGTEGGYADDEVWEKMVDDWEDAFQLKMHEEKEKEICFPQRCPRAQAPFQSERHPRVHPPEPGG